MSVSPARWGLTIPLDGVPLPDQIGLFGRLESMGFTDLWSSEAASVDGFTPLVLAAERTDGARLGTGVVSVFTRGPATLAMHIAALAELAPGRVAAGIGASSPVVVEQWNATSYHRPLARVQDMVRFLRRALAGEKVNEEYNTFAVRGFRLDRAPTIPVPIFLAALRPQMLRLAAAEADGAIAVFVSAEDAGRVAEELGGKDLVVRVLVHVGEDASMVRSFAKPHLAAYLNVPAYEAYHRWLGRGDLLEAVWGAWKAGDRRAAAAAVPDSVVDDLVVWGSPSDCRAKIAKYVENGVSCPVLALQPWGLDPLAAVEVLAR